MYEFEEISQIAFDAAVKMNDRINELLELSRNEPMLSQKLRIQKEIKMLKRDRRRLLVRQR